METIGFVKLESETKDKGQRIEVYAVAPAEKVSQVISDFYQLMSRVKDVEFVDTEDARQKLEELVGEADLREACRDFALNKFTMAAVRQLDIDTVLTPGVHAEGYPSMQADFAFTINLTPRPELSLSSIEPVRVEKSAVTVEERDIDDQILYTAKQFSTLRKSERQVLREGDFALMDVDMLLNGKLCKDLSGARRVVKVKRGLLPDAFIDGIAGMEAGQIRKFVFDMVTTDIDRAPGELDHYTADVRLWEVQEKEIPVITDEWVAENLPQFGSMEGFRAYIRQDLESQKSRVEQQDMVCKVRSALEKRLVGSIPDEMYEEAKESLLTSTVRKIESTGKTLEDYCEEHSIGKEAFNMNVFMQASEYLRQNLALDVLAGEKGFCETEEEVRRVKSSLPEAVSSLSDEQFVERGFRKSLGEQIRRKKAMDWLMQTAIVE